MQHVDMEVQHVELVGAPAHFLQHRQVRGEIGLEHCRIEPDRLVAHRHQFGAGARIGAGEQRHLMAQINQRVGKVSDDALGAAVEFRRGGFVQRRNLGDAHEVLGTLASEAAVR